MKRMKKVFALLLTMVMVLAMAVPAMAAGTGTITITPPTGTPSDATNTYKVYKVFDADGNGKNISYKLPAGKTLTSDMATYFAVDNAGNVTAKDAAKGSDGKLTENAIKAIADFVKNDTPVDTVTSTGTTAATTKALPNGYYYITTSTGTAVTIDSTNPSANVIDKGSVPDVDKAITGVGNGSLDAAGEYALAQVGTSVDYEIEITVVSNTKNLKLQDALGSGLKLNQDTLKVQVNSTDVAASNYTKTLTDNLINISFNDTYVAGLAANTKIVVTYSALITDDNLITSPATNTASITYGDNNAKITSDNIPKVYNATITVNKSFQGLAENTELASGEAAEFVLTKTVTNDDKTTTTLYYNNTNSVVTWVDSIENATKVTFTKAGSGKFTGLADGTYTLVESKVPAGYNKAEDQSITIEAGNYTSTNLNKTADIENKTGAALPSTGGIGTTIFYVIGAICVLGAGVLLVTRRRMSSK